MKSTITRRTWKAIYKLLDYVSPVNFDCGKICGSICCNPEINNTNIKDEDIEVGIFLLPGEEKIHHRKDDWLNWSFLHAEEYDYPESWNGKVFFVKCTTPPICPRKKRPLQCRFYPLYPYIDENDKLSLIYHPFYTPYNCPLIDNKVKLNDKFFKAILTVWKRLIKDPLIYDLIKYESDNIIPIFYEHK